MIKLLILIQTFGYCLFSAVDTCNVNKGLPSIVLAKNKTFTVSTAFSHSVGGKPIEERTILNLKYDDSCLRINFECFDDPWAGFTTLTQESRTLSTQEVFEIFISNGAVAPEQYLEVQVNPNNALFLAKISNRYKTDKRYNYERLNPRDAGVLHAVSRDIENKKWQGTINLPLQLLKYPNEALEDTFRLNMFRIILNKKPESEIWSCTPQNSTFACWSATLTAVPQFHVPEKFGYLIFK